jgi:hypothetical protein
MLSWVACITMPNVTGGEICFPRGHCNLVALLKHLWITKLTTTYGDLRQSEILIEQDFKIWYESEVLK